MNGISLINKTFTAIAVNDKSAGLWTVYLDGAGGPIISDPDLETAKTKFGEAMKLSVAVRNLRFFAQAVKADDDAKNELAENANPISTEKITFVEKEMDLQC